MSEHGGYVKNTDVEISSSSHHIGIPSDVEYYDEGKLLFGMGYYQFCGMVFDTFGGNHLSRNGDVLEDEYIVGTILTKLESEGVSVSVSSYHGAWDCVVDSKSVLLGRATVQIESSRHGSGGARRLAVTLAALEYKGKISLNK
jgi:hypothetical protein